ncbi:hypothetical protein PN478_03875 [Dolichospermum circinale CS-534/05]|uniref:hypothetical protein n=1 Tax=Dolichospermum circinale TaxID=109265 RepID=UPI00232F529C|nr:hypothetical protein [Dolichospermum circinale]MDB9489665.1 hypothetical protein [Dolichospermum circinale CS-534/05]
MSVRGFPIPGTGEVRKGSDRSPLIRAIAFMRIRGNFRSLLSRYVVVLERSLFAGDDAE